MGTHQYNSYAPVTQVNTSIRRYIHRYTSVYTGIHTSITVMHQLRRYSPVYTGRIKKYTQVYTGTYTEVYDIKLNLTYYASIMINAFKGPIMLKIVLV